jgi:hypothetical protein
MWFDDNIKNYAEINYIINTKYCSKYGYNIIKCQNKRTNMNPHWERIPLMIEHLNNYDYVIWIDADAFFFKESPPITNVIEEYSDKLFILSGDIFKQNENDINTGFIIVKKSPISINILNEWYTNDELIKYNDEYNNIKHGYIQDQGALRHMYEYNLCQIRDYSVIIPYGVLQTFPSNQSERLNNINKYGLTNSAFVVHLAGDNSKTRLYFSENYLKYNYNKTCKCGFKKEINKYNCCFYCYKSNGHGPNCKKQKDNNLI